MIRWLCVFTLAGLLVSGSALLTCADEGEVSLPEPEQEFTDETALESELLVEEPVEFGQDLQMLDEQIAEQEALLEAAETDEERQLIENHIALLQQERASLESATF